MRLILAYLAAAGVAVAGALILGEYPFKGLVVLGSGVVLGLFVGEAAIAVHGDSRRGRPAWPERRGRPGIFLGIGCGVASAAAMVWAAWISTGHHLSFVGAAGWASIALAGVTGFARASWSRRERDTPVEASAPATSPEDSPE